jgi:hypothetical protein
LLLRSKYPLEPVKPVRLLCRLYNALLFDSLLVHCGTDETGLRVFACLSRKVSLNCVNAILSFHVINLNVFTGVRAHQQYCSLACLSRKVSLHCVNAILSKLLSFHVINLNVFTGVRAHQQYCSLGRPWGCFERSNQWGAGKKLVVAAGFCAELVVAQQRGSSAVRREGAGASILRQPGTGRYVSCCLRSCVPWWCGLKRLVALVRGCVNKVSFEDFI